MKVCGYCLQAIESHEGKQKIIPLSRIEDKENGDDYAICEWCGELELIDNMFQI